jgi:CubicO group peptidase (beta-lactamase class C family)
MSQNIRKYIYTSFLFVCLISPSVFPQSATVQPSDKYVDKLRIFEEFVRKQMEKDKIPGLTIGFYKDDYTWVKGFGNGYLYLRDGGGLKLFEYKPGIFFTADGEAVIFHGDRMLLSNTPYLKKSTKTSLDVPQSTVTQPADKEDARQKPTIGQQDKNLPVEMPTVDQILDKYVQALGGTEAIRKLKTRVVKGTITIQTKERTLTGNSEIYTAAPNKGAQIHRLKTGNCYNVDTSEGFNGTDSWSSEGESRKLVGAELAAEKRENEFFWEIKLKELYPRIILIGKEKVDDRWTYVLEATPAEGNPEKMYFDIETGLLVRRDVTKDISRGERGAVQHIFEGYKELDGIKLPFTFHVISPESTIIFKANEIRHNIPIESAKFDHPDPALSSLSAPTTDEYIQVEMKKRCIPGLALVVIKNGEVVKMKGYGIANLEHDVPVTADTVFELASVTKQFTATAIMRLVEKGKVKLDDPIVQYLPGSPSKWNGVTVRHLLTHTGGMAALGVGSADSFNSATNDPMSFKPGERYQYSDVGYFLLGMIIEKASGQRYKDFLADHFFKPLGMTSTSVLDQWAILKNRAAGYTLRKGQLVNIRRTGQHELPSHYGIFSTVKDLAKWEIALASGKVVNESSLTAMWTPVKLNEGTSYPYGFGWELKNVHGHRVITHGGITGTEFTRFPDDKLTVIALTNLGYRFDGDYVNSWGLTQEIAMRYLSGLP